MFLRTLTLENVRCFSRLELDFAEDEWRNRKWTILLGENATGKSTVLQAAAIVTCGSDALTELLGEPASWVRSGANACVIEAVLQTRKTGRHSVRLELRKRDSIDDVIARCKSTMQPLDNAIERTERDYFVAGYGASRRLGSSASLAFQGVRFGSVRARTIATLFDHDFVLSPLETWATDLDYQHNKEIMKKVGKALASFLPGLSFVGFEKDSNQLIFKTPDGSIPLRRLSGGYQNVAAWVGDLIHRTTHIFEDRDAPLDAEGVLIIDELDLHLHPAWQRALHSFLEKALPHFQLLVTTNSPVTAQQAGASQLHYLKRMGREVNLYRFEAEPSQLLVGQLLLSEAFGLSTDESVDVEKMKNRYRELRDRKELTPEQRIELSTLKAVLSESVQGGKRSIKLQEEHAALLQKVEQELSNKES